MTSINDTAADEEINTKVVAAVKRGGSKVVNVLLVNTLHEVVLAWSVVEGVVEPCDTEPFKSTPQAPADGEPVVAEEAPAAGTEEVEVAKKAKAKKERKPRAKSDKPRGEKVAAIVKLLTRASGCTAKEVLAATGWPSVSMPAMAKACGLKLRKEKEKGKPTRYFGS